MGYRVEIIGLYECREEWELERIVLREKNMGQVKNILEIVQIRCRNEGMWDVYDMVRGK